MKDFALLENVRSVNVFAIPIQFAVDWRIRTVIYLARSCKKRGVSFCVPR